MLKYRQFLDSLLFEKKRRTGKEPQPKFLISDHTPLTIDYRLLKFFLSKTDDFYYKSPFSQSYYTEQVDWDHKPDGSYRLSDHWNFKSVRTGDKIHCATKQPVENNTRWSIGKYDGESGQYDIVMSLPFINSSVSSLKNKVLRDLLKNKHLKEYKAGKKRQELNESVIDTSKSGISRRELSDICNLFSDEGGSYEISVGLIEKMHFFGCFWKIKLECSHRDFEKMSDVVNEIRKRIHNETGDVVIVNGKNNWSHVADGNVNFSYIWAMNIPIGNYKTLDFSINENESDIMHILLELDLEKIGFSEEEQVLLNSIKFDQFNIRDITLKQFGLLHEYLDLDLTDIGLSDHQRGIAASLYRKLDNPVFE